MTVHQVPDSGFLILSVDEGRLSIRDDFYEKEEEAVADLVRLVTVDERDVAVAPVFFIVNATPNRGLGRSDVVGVASSSPAASTAALALSPVSPIGGRPRGLYGVLRWRFGRSSTQAKGYVPPGKNRGVVYSRKGPLSRVFAGLT